MEYYKAIKRDELRLFVTMRLALNNMLGKNNHVSKYSGHWDAFATTTTKKQ